MKIRYPFFSLTKLFSLLTILLSTLFIIFPSIDLAVANYFYIGEGKFIGTDTDWAHIVGKKLRPAIFFLCLSLTSLFFILLIARPSKYAHLKRRIFYFSFVLIITPGLLVNEILKRFIGRARPYKIKEFGGEAEFSPAYIVSKECSHNCSFVSGDVSFAACLLSLVFIVPARFKAFVFSLILFLILGSSYYRMAVGKHFLSDVVLAALFSIVTCFAFRQLFLGRHEDEQKVFPQINYSIPDIFKNIRKSST